MLVRAYLYLKLFVSLVKIMNLANLANLAKFLIFMICICYDYFNVVENKHNLLNAWLISGNVLPHLLTYYNFTSIGQVDLPILHP